MQSSIFSSIGKSDIEIIASKTMAIYISKNYIVFFRKYEIFQNIGNSYGTTAGTWHVRQFAFDYCNLEIQAAAPSEQYTGCNNCILGFRMIFCDFLSVHVCFPQLSN